MDFLLPIPVWGTQVVFFIDETEESLKECIKRNSKNLTLKDIEELRDALKDDTIDGQVNSFEKGGYYCLIKSPYDENCWAHEIFHVVNRILTDRGVVHESSAEPWAYLDGFIVKLYLREIRPAYAKEKKKNGTKSVPNSNRETGVQKD